MKKLLSTLLLILVAQTCLAQQMCEMIYIYRNDGELNKFLRDEVKSFSYSNATQIVETADSTYDIPLAAIDSVCFVTDEYITVTDQTDFNMFRLVSGTGQSYKPFLIDADAIHIKVPHDEDLTSLRPKFRHNGLRVMVADRELKSGEDTLDFSDFLQPIEFVVESSVGTRKSRKVILYDLPVMIVNTPDGNPIESKYVRTEGCAVALIDDSGERQDLGTASIKGRGNSTWLLPKKPYNIKLDKKHPVLGMKASKHWNLLANAYYDRTQLRNAVAYEMARLTDYPWVQDGAFVELVMNNRHLGLYYLCEKIRIEKGRIDIEEIAPTDTMGEELTGGYLLETDVTDTPDDSPNTFMTDYINRTGEDLGLYIHWELKSPDGDVPPQQINYIRDALNHTERLIQDPDSLATGKYREFFDIESAINWWLVQEATLNEESSRSKNIFMYKERSGKFVVGPPWDFDAWTFGLYGTRHFSCTRRSFYIRHLLQDPYFLERAREKWAVYKDLWTDSIKTFINTHRELIIRAAERNEKMWPDYHVLNFANDKTFVESIGEMYGALVDQIRWMDEKLKEGDFSDWWENK